MRRASLAAVALFVASCSTDFGVSPPPMFPRFRLEPDFEVLSAGVPADGWTREHDAHMSDALGYRHGETTDRVDLYDALWTHTDGSQIFIRRIPRRPTPLATIEDYVLRTRGTGYLRVRDFVTSPGDRASSPDDGVCPSTAQGYTSERARDCVAANAIGNARPDQGALCLVHECRPSGPTDVALAVVDPNGSGLVILVVLAQPEGSHHEPEAQALLRALRIEPHEHR